MANRLWLSADAAGFFNTHLGNQLACIQTRQMCCRLVVTFLISMFPPIICHCSLALPADFIYSHAPRLMCLCVCVCVCVCVRECIRVCSTMYLCVCAPNSLVHSHCGSICLLHFSVFGMAVPEWVHFVSSSQVNNDGSISPDPIGT